MPRRALGCPPWVERPPPRHEERPLSGMALKPPGGRLGSKAGTQTETPPKPSTLDTTGAQSEPSIRIQTKPTAPLMAWELILTGTPAADAALNDPDDRIRCDACPVMCVIRPGQAGACDRYANRGGALVRVDPHVILSRTIADNGRVVRFGAAEWGDVAGAKQERGSMGVRRSGLIPGSFGGLSARRGSRGVLEGRSIPSLQRRRRMGHRRYRACTRPVAATRSKDHPASQRCGGGGGLMQF